MYFLGDYRWDGEFFAWPKGATAAICLAPPAATAEALANNATSHGGGLFVSDTPLDGCTEINEQNNTRLRDALATATGYRPEGTTLAECLRDILTQGADPAGESAVAPLVPTSQGNLEIYLGRQFSIEPFKWGQHPHTNKLTSLLQKQTDRHYKEDPEHVRRVLDATCCKYRIEDWKQFTPTKLRKKIPGRLKHETTHSDSFTGTDGTVLPNFTTTFGIQWEIASNQARSSSTVGVSRQRYNTDLSSDDMRVQLTLNSSHSGAYAGPLARHSAADAHYLWSVKTSATATRLMSAGGTTIYSSDAAVTLPCTLRISSNGSTIKSFYNGVLEATVTDTSIAGNLRGGMRGSGNGTVGNRALIDDFSQSDIPLIGSGRVGSLTLTGAG